MTRIATVSITFLTSSEGGRSHPPDLQGGRYRPTVRAVGWPSERQVAVILEGGGSGCALGVQVEARLVPMVTTDVWDELEQGAELELREGERVVARGVVRSTSSEPTAADLLVATSSTADDALPVRPWRLPMLEEPRGMGGWLLFFLISVAARSVLALLGFLGALAQMVNHPGSEAVLGGLAVAILVVAISSGWVTAAFWRRKPDAVRLLPAYFTLLLAYGIALIGLPLARHDASSTRYLQSMSRYGVYTLMYVGIWVAYFRTSRRVSNTFGPDGVMA